MDDGTASEVEEVRAGAAIAGATELLKHETLDDDQILTVTGLSHPTVAPDVQLTTTA